MPGIPARREPHPDSSYPSRIVGKRAKDARRLHDRLSQEAVADRMVVLGHGTWTRQTVGQVENAARNLTVDELVSLAAALQTVVAYLLSPASPADPYTDEPVDIGGPDALGRDKMISLYGFTRNPYPHAWGYYEWPEMTFKMADGWDEVKWQREEDLDTIATLLSPSGSGRDHVPVVEEEE